MSNTYQDENGNTQWGRPLSEKYNLYKELTDNSEAFFRWEYLIGCFDIDNKLITKKRLVKWACTEEKKLVCLYCSSNNILDDGQVIGCNCCKEYKGILPDFGDIE